MATAFITGATGFLGRHLVDVLLENGWDITALVRNPEKAKTLLGENVTLIKGDITEPLTITNAMPEAVDAVFHTAADTSTWSAEAHQQEIVNIEGTRAILQAMLDKNAKRLVHVSSIAAFGHHDDVITEKTPREGATSWINYTRTKSYAERKVKEAVDRGMDAVIVNPTHIVGRYDDHNWSRLIQQLTDGSLPAILPGSGNFANGRAVAEAVLNAYHKGQTGHNYILGGPHASFRTFLEIAAEKTGVHKLPPQLPAWLLGVYAGMLAFAASITGKRPKVTREEAHFACENQDARSDKAIEELGYRIVPLEQSISESVAYLQETGALSK